MTKIKRGQMKAIETPWVILETLMNENIGLKPLENLEMEYKIMKKKVENAKGLVNTSKGIHEWVQQSIVNLLNN